MRAAARWFASEQPLLGFSEATTSRLRWAAWVSSGFALVGTFLGGRFEWFDTRPGRSAFPLTIQPVFIVMFIVGLLLAARWEIVGGTVAAFTATGLAVFAAQQLEPVPAVIVVAAFLLPGLMWILVDLHDFRPTLAAFAIALIGGAVVAGGLLAHDVHSSVFGPTHPESATADVSLPVDWAWAGAVTQDSAVVVARIPDVDAPRLMVAAEGDANGSDLAVQGEPGFDETFTFELTDLEPGVDYRYGLDADGLTSVEPIGTFRTFPEGAESFTIAVSSCARVGSNGAVFDAIGAVDPLLYLVTGDFHYANIDVDDRDEIAEVLDFTLSRPAPAALYRTTPIAYVWDDHDYGGDGSDKTSESRSAALQTYRSHVPHYPLTSDDGPIYQAFTIGRVRFILTDGRSERTPTTAPDDERKTMLGEEQKAWLKAELRDASETHALVVWVNPVPWIAEPEPGEDHWGGYTTERAELADHIANNGIDNLLMVSGDAHMLAIDDGSNSDYSSAATGGFPVLHAAALDRPGRVKGGPYSHGALGGSGQFATVTVNDPGVGQPIEVELAGLDWEGNTLMSYEFSVSTSTGVNDG